MIDRTAIEKAKEHFGKLLEAQMERVTRLKAAPDWVDYSRISPVKIGILPGDGIGPFIAAEAERVLRFMLEDELKKGKVQIDTIEGLTIENRAAHNKAIPDDVLEEIKKYLVTLKGPTTTPRKGDPWPNIESCNVAMRNELDLFANVRPVRVPKQGIDWIFFRENTEDLYALGSKGIDVDGDIAIDFKLITTPGSDRICRMAFEYARKNKRRSVTIVEKPNVLRETGGLMLGIARDVAREFSDIPFKEANVDAMAMWLVKNPEDYDILVAENLFGDIISDLAAQLVGGLGFACSGNIGDRYAVFEPTHGSAPKYAGQHKVNPMAMLLAAKMMLEWLGEGSKAAALEDAIAEVIREGKVRTYDMAGSASTLDVAREVASKL